MNDIIQKIQRDISEGFTEEALKKAITLANKKGYKSQLNYLHLLSSRLQRYQREYLGGLTLDITERNKIDLALLSIIDSIIRINEPIQPNRKKEKFLGKVWYMNNAQHYGFIKSQDFKNEIFFHFSSLNNGRKPKMHQKVKFELDKNLKGWYSPSVELLVRTRKRKRLTKSQKKKRDKEQTKELIENDVKFFFRRIENFVLKIINQFFK